MHTHKEDEEEEKNRKKLFAINFLCVCLFLYKKELLAICVY